MPFFVKPEKRKICMVLELEYDRQESTSLIGPHTPPCPRLYYGAWFVLKYTHASCLHLSTFTVIYGAD